MHKHKKELAAALVSVTIAAAFVIGMRIGWRIVTIPEPVSVPTVDTEEYLDRINALEIALAEAQKMEHIVYEYSPLPVDYANIGTEMPSEDDVVLLAKMFYKEAGIGNTFSQIAACGDCALFRVEAGYGTLSQVITSPGQFLGYNAKNPVDARMYNIAKDCIIRHELAAWERETFGFTMVSTTIPSEYLWFSGDGYKNVFTDNDGGRITP